LLLVNLRLPSEVNIEDLTIGLLDTVQPKLDTVCHVNILAKDEHSI
jgi:hypothetical protein